MIFVDKTWPREWWTVPSSCGWQGGGRMRLMSGWCQCRRSAVLLTRRTSTSQPRTALLPQLFTKERNLNWLRPYLKSSFNIFGSKPVKPRMPIMPIQYNKMMIEDKLHLSLHTFSIKMQFYVVSPDFYENNTKTFFPGPRCASSNWIVDVSPERRYADSPPMHNLNFSLRQLIQSPAARAPAWAGERSGDTR